MIGMEAMKTIAKTFIVKEFFDGDQNNIVKMGGYFADMLSKMGPDDFGRVHVQRIVNILARIATEI